MDTILFSLKVVRFGQEDKLLYAQNLIKELSKYEMNAGFTFILDLQKYKL